MGAVLPLGGGDGLHLRKNRPLGRMAAGLWPRSMRGRCGAKSGFTARRRRESVQCDGFITGSSPLSRVDCLLSVFHTNQIYY